MQEHRPCLPRVFERDLEFLYVLHHSEAPLRIGMRERARPGHRRLVKHAGGDELQQRLGRLRGQVIREGEEAVLVRRLHIGDPVLRHAN